MLFCFVARVYSNFYNDVMYIPSRGSFSFSSRTKDIILIFKFQIYTFDFFTDSQSQSLQNSFHLHLPNTALTRLDAVL